MKKVAFYGRYSSYSQTEQSIEGQLHVCEQYAEQNELEIVCQYIDRAASGTTDKRPQFQQMISDSESGAFEGILVYKLDRFSRNRYDSAVYKKKLRDRGIRIYSATENLTDTPEGIIMEALVEGMDEYYSAELARKMKRGKEESFHKGKFLGPLAPYGYKIENHCLVIDSLTSPIVLEIFQRYANGEKHIDIVNNLNERGIPNVVGTKWRVNHTSKMLRSEIYIGKYTIKNMEGFSPCPAIISEELFNRVQERRLSALHRARKSRTEYQYLLTGKATCSICGKSVYGTSQHLGKYHYYRCVKNCFGNLPCDEIHERVCDAVREYLTDEKLDEIATAVYQEYSRKDAPASEYDILHKELKDVNRQLQNAVDAVLNGFASDSLKSTMTDLEKRKRELANLISKEVVAPPKLTFEHFRFALEILIEKANSDNMKSLVDAIVNLVVVDGDRLIICINLTDESNTPPLEQIMLSVSDVQTPNNQSKIYCVSGWLLIAA